MTAATQTAPQARLGAPVYETDHKPHTVLGIRATGTLAVGIGETIDMVKIPAGARITDCRIWADGAAGCEDVDVGLYQTDTDNTVIDADGLIENVDLNTSLYAARWTGKAKELMVGPAQTYESVVRVLFNTIALTDAVTFYCAVTYIMP